MDPEDDWAPVAVQDMMCLLTDNPRPFMERPMWRMFEQAERAQRGLAYSGIDYLTMPF
jgi:hypothetical protein